MVLSGRTTGLLTIACIALGTAAVGAVLSLVSVALLQPAPFPDAERLHRVWVARDGGDARIDLSLPEARELSATMDALGSWAIAARSRAVARLPGGTERLRGEAVTPNYLGLLGIAPALGRGWGPDDFAAEAQPAALISDALWRRAFGANPAVLGRTLVTEERTLTIVGVLPAGFAGSIENDEVEYWLPLPQYIPARIRDDRDARQSWTLLRLDQGATPEALAAQLALVQADWKRRFPEQYRELALRSEPFGENWRAPLRGNALLLSAAVLVLLGIAALNVAALQLARALERRRELAVRAALGASRLRVAGWLFRESAALVLAGGALGALAATPLLKLFLLLMPGALPSYIRIGFDPLAVALSVAAIGMAALVAGAVPAVLGSRAAPAQALASGARGSTTGPREQRWGERLVAVELALTVVLLVAGGLLVRSWLAMSGLELGYRSDQVLRLAVTLDRGEAAAAGPLQPLQQRLLEAVRSQPGVLAAGMVWPTLPPWDEQRLPIADPGAASAEARLTAGVHLVDPGLLDTLDIRLLHGRGIEASDWQQQARVAVISAALAERFGGAVQAVGREVDFGPEPAGGIFRTSGRFRIVGVAGNVAWDGLAEHGTGRTIRHGAGTDPRAQAFDVYLPLPPVARGLSIAVHTGPDPLAMLDPVRRALASVAPGSAVHWVSSMEDELADEYAAARFYTLLVLAFASCAVLLAAVGLFALLSRTVLGRRGEIGIRLALGATAPRVAREVVLGGLRGAATGLAAGLVLAWIAARALEGFLYGVGPADPLAFAAAALVLSVFVLLAALLPARRAARVHPLLALQGD
jgi:predicted permease